MRIDFSVTDDDVVALALHLYRTDPNTQRLQNTLRNSLSLFIAAITLFSIFSLGKLMAHHVVFLIAAILTFFLYPIYFRWSTKNRVLKTYSLPENAKNLGSYELDIQPDHLTSASPIGRASYCWSKLRPPSIADGYLFIPITGLSGFAVALDQIGEATALEARDLMLRFKRESLEVV